MKEVIVCEIHGEKRYYGGYFSEGFAECGPIWRKTNRGESARFTPEVAEKVISQIWSMGYAAQRQPIRVRQIKGEINDSNRNAA